MNLPQEAEGQILYPQLDLSLLALDTLIWGLHSDPYFLSDRPDSLLEAVSRPHHLGSGRVAWEIGSAGPQDSDREAVPVGKRVEVGVGQRGVSPPTCPC